MKRKKILAGLLSAMLVTGGIAPCTYAENTSETSIPVEKVDWNQVKQQDGTILDTIQTEKKDTTDEEKMVTAIVQIKGKPMLSLYHASNSTDLQQYLQDHSAKRLQIQNQLRAVETTVLNLVEKMGKEASVGYEYDTLFNGFSVQVPEGKLEEIQKLPGVRSVHVAATYDAVDPVETDKKTTLDAQNSSNRVMIGADQVQNQPDMDYTGKGETIAILDTGLDYRHEAFTNAPKEARYSAKDIQTLLDENSFASEQSFPCHRLTTTGADSADSVYKSEKVPYAYDYMDGDTDVIPHDKNASIEHGTHVAGIAAGDCENLQGIAPDAQLLIFKVFSDNGGNQENEDDVLAALQDAVLLKADVINMSLGTPCGFSTKDDSFAQSVYDAIKEAGISLNVAVGNEADSASKSTTGNLARVDAIDTGMAGDPSTMASSLSVASVDNTILSHYPYITDSAGKNHLYSESPITGKEFSTLGKGIFSYVDCGYGEMSDFEGRTVSGQIALIQRGGAEENGEVLTFSKKIINAAKNGAKAVVIYDNKKETLPGMLIEEESYLIPCIMVSLKSGETLKKLLENGQGTISYEPGQLGNVENETGGQLSTFSSWGPTPDLRIKPEISAPGGTIYSAVPLKEDGQSTYENMSGTSMATPHMAGACAVLRQYLKEKSDMTKESNGETIEQIATKRLMSTAVLVEDKEHGADGQTLYYPVRQQGAGLVNLSSAMKTDAYLNVKGCDRPKAELGYNETGTYSFTAELVNTGADTRSYELNSTIQIPAFIEANGEQYLETYDQLLDSDSVSVSYTGASVSGNTVTVLPQSSAEILVTIQLNQQSSLLARESRVFTNGFYVEGFFSAKSKVESQPDLHIPMLGFYGDWGDAKLFDSSFYDTDTQADFAACTLYAEETAWNGNEFVLGQNPLAALTAQGDLIPHKDRIMLSPNSLLLNSIHPNTGLLRGADTLEYRLSNDSQTVIDERFTHVSRSHLYNSVMYSAEVLLKEAKEMSEDTFSLQRPNGTTVADGAYEFTITGTKAGVKEGPNKTETLTYPVIIDSVVPSLDPTQVSVKEQNGHLYVTLAATDNRGLSGFEVDIPNHWGQCYSVPHISDCTLQDAVTLDLGSIKDLEKKGCVLNALRVLVYDYAMNVSGTVLPVSITEHPDQSEDQTADQPSDPKPSTPSTEPSTQPSTEPSTEPSTTPPSDVKTVSGVTAKSTGKGTIQLSWKSLKNVSGYEVYRSTSKTGTFKRVKTVSKNTYTDSSSLTFGKTYYYKVRAYKEDNKQTVRGAYSKTIAVASTHFGTMKWSTGKRLSNSKVKLKWKAMAGASGYELYRSTKKNGTYKKVKSISSGKTTAYTVKVAKNQTAYFKVRPIGTYQKQKIKGQFSAVKAVAGK